MRPAVRDEFIAFSAGFEGRCPFMYLDVTEPAGLVTTGVGNLIDPMERAYSLPWRRADGSMAALTDIVTEWQTVKGMDSHKHGPTSFWKTRARLTLTTSAIDALVLQRLDETEKELRIWKEFSKIEEWPADAQLALYSMAWAMGAGKFEEFTKFRAACFLKVWNVAAAECKIVEEGNAGIIPRNRANVILFTNANSIEAQGKDPSRLFYPSVVAA